jgi:hypothetical protein
MVFPPLFLATSSTGEKSVDELIITYVCTGVCIFCLWVIVRRYHTIKEKPVRKRTKVILAVLTGMYVLSFVVALACLASTIRNVLWGFRFPSRKLHLPVCSLVCPKGWYVETNPGHNPAYDTEILYISRLQAPDKLPEADPPWTTLYFGNGSDENSFLRCPIGKFLLDMKAQRTIRKLDGLDAVVYRYEGPKFRCLGEKHSYNIEEDKTCLSVTIGICSNFGFYATFWGLPGDEEIFWTTLKSIKWNFESRLLDQKH